MMVFGDGITKSLKNSMNLTPLRRKKPEKKEEMNEENENVDLRMSINLQLGSH